MKVRKELPPAYQDVLDFAYYSGWRRNEILYLTWDEVDLSGGVVRLAPQRSKTRTGRVLPISVPLRAVLDRRAKQRKTNDPASFVGMTFPYGPGGTRFVMPVGGLDLLIDCCTIAARNLVRAGVPKRVAMTLTRHKTRAVFDRYNIVNEDELLNAGQRLIELFGARSRAEEARRRSRRMTTT